MPRKSYREKHREELNQKDKERYQKKKEESLKLELVENDCAKFRRLILAERRNPDDGFYCNNHFCNCIECQKWYVIHKHENEWDFTGVNLWHPDEVVNSEFDEQKQLEEELKKEGFDYKRSSNPSENPLGLENSKEFDREWCADPKEKVDVRPLIKEQIEKTKQPKQDQQEPQESEKPKESENSA